MKVIKRKICYLDAPCNIAVMTHQALHLLVKIYILVDALIYDVRCQMLSYEISIVCLLFSFSKDRWSKHTTVGH